MSNTVIVTTKGKAGRIARAQARAASKAIAEPEKVTTKPTQVQAADAKRRRNEAVAAALAGLDWNPPLPLAVGIHRQIRAAKAAGIAPWAGLSNSTIRLCLARHTRSPAYRQALAAPDSRRVNLDGTDAGEAHPDHRYQAMEVSFDPPACHSPASADAWGF